MFPVRLQITARTANVHIPSVGTFVQVTVVFVVVGMHVPQFDVRMS